MTKAEELDWLYRLRSNIDVYMPREWLIPMNNSLDAAIKALEKEPCEDAISRQSMLDYLKYLHGEMSEEEFIKELPSVTPARKKGHWIDHSDEGYVECSSCGSATNCDGNIADLHFCFNCGAEMDEDGRTLKYADQDTMMSADGKERVDEDRR